MEVLRAGTATFEERYIPDFARLREIVIRLKNEGHRIVLTQGVFDLLHIGHASYLNKAKELGDVLIVGVDSDALARRRKTPNRPIVPQDERVRLLSHLRSVDIVTLRDTEQEINELVRIVRPDVLIASETTKDFPWQALKPIEALCGKIVRLPAQATTSTTERIRRLEIDGVDLLAQRVADALPEHLREVLPSIIERIRNSP
ncbi:MAG: adenylyltransferase/cytidyltransferase family protein [Candidatus Vogelbacteria bacterium]|nr:adenylyltransferase/cytidyltransferase family protein [Candidatus Vogelbacteria bacterium]